MSNVMVSVSSDMPGSGVLWGRDGAENKDYTFFNSN